MLRPSESGHVPLISYGGHPQWLSIAVSQILAVTDTQSIVYTAHSLEDYNLTRVPDGFQDTAEGHIVAVTKPATG